MKDTSQTYDATIPRGCLVSIGIAVLLCTAGGASSAQEGQGISKLPTAGQAIIEATAGNRQRTSQPVLQHRDPRYQLCKGDTFELTFPFTPEFNQTVTIQPDGYITLTAVGDLYVERKTVPQLRESIRT